MKESNTHAAIKSTVASLSLNNSQSGEKELIPAGKLERLPKWLNCVPLVIQWLWLSIRYRSITLPSACNPDILSGGMVGEGKAEYFKSMTTAASKYIPNYITISVSQNSTVQAVCKSMDEQGMHFPIIAKPNIGWCGYGVCLLQTTAELGDYLKDYPKNEILVLQEYLPQSGEAGLFYVRYPGDATGKIIGITLRYFPQITGDGVSTIQSLIEKDARLHRVKISRWHHSKFQPDRIPGVGETVRLATIGSTRVGGLYCDGSQHITAALDKVIDSIARNMNEFYVGRFDVRYESLESLRAGKDFKIMEVNGAGSEAVHAWDPKYSLRQSYRIIFAKQRMLFRIGHANRRRGIKPIGLWKLATLHFAQQRLINRYPPSN